jgi:hypothetical protein
MERDRFPPDLLRSVLRERPEVECHFETPATQHRGNSS